MEGLQVLNRARAPEVEGVLTDADIARGVALTLRDMCEFVFDDRALSQGLASSGRLYLLAEPWLTALVHCGRTGQRSHTSGSNSTTLPNAKRCTCPLGHSIVRSRRFSLKADLGNKRPLCDFQGLHTILPRRVSTSTTRVLLMYPRSITNWSTVRACRSKSVVNAGMASSSGRFAGVMAHAKINP